MKGADTPELYNKFADAVSGFPPTRRPGRKADQVFSDSYRLLNELATPAFPRAMAWKAYALALSAYESWTLPSDLPEAAWDSDKRKEEAEKLAIQAKDLDPTDYDLYWALADVYLIRTKYTEAVETFQLALDYNRHERHPNLFAEAAAAMMHDGDHRQSGTNFDKAKRRPDWHRWMNGILLLMRAGRPNEDQEALLDDALAELGSTHAAPGQDNYQEEIQLVLAVIYWKKYKRQESEARSTQDPRRRRWVEASASANKSSAERAIRQFRRNFKKWEVAEVETALPFREPEDKAFFMETVVELFRVPL